MPQAPAAGADSAWRTRAPTKRSIGFEEYSYAKGVIAGTLTDEHAAAGRSSRRPTTDDWQSRRRLARVNPGFGVTVQPDGLAQEALEAAERTAEAERFLRYPLEQLDESSDRLAAARVVDRVRRADAVDPRARRATNRRPASTWRRRLTTRPSSSRCGSRCRPGETSTTAEVTDETGATTERPLDYSIAVFPYYWLPEDMLREREQTDGLPLSLYKSRGQLFTSPGATITADQVYRDIMTTIAPQFPRLRTIGFDPAFAPDVAQRLSAAFTRDGDSAEFQLHDGAVLHARRAC